AREVNGVLLVIDGTRPEDFGRAKQMMGLVGNSPVVVLANKADLAGSMTLDEIRRGLQLTRDTPIVPTVATEGKGLRDALKILAEMIMG
ncbi:MAG TPA: ADP-ribosylation factor-like protein, partial [Thermoplasmata archaeon]|nr:ADP-ribosylation factor-like protein [Thermoplasmata archaeon]